MPERPVFTVRPRLRCFGRSASSTGLRCGKPAAWMSALPVDGEYLYRCQDCRENGDTPIPVDPVFRRVQVELEVLISAAALKHGPAVREALDALEAAITQAGGVLNLHEARSVIGRYSPPAPLRRRRPVGGGQ